MYYQLIRRVLISITLGILLVTVTPIFATADPDNTSSSAMLAQYEKLSHQAEKTTEELKTVEDKLAGLKKEITVATAEVRTATAELDRLNKLYLQLKKRVQTFVLARYKGARVNSSYAVLTADSPQVLLDQMSTLEILRRNITADIKKYQSVRKNVEVTRTAAAKVKNVATAKEKESRVTQLSLKKKQAQQWLQIIRIKAIYEALSGRQLRQLAGGTVQVDPKLLPKGTGRQALAVQAALTRVGSPYVWGATGPTSFDCSGLMLWAYRQAGVSLPRTSQAQLGGGRPVNRSELQPGDLVIYYSSASHVAMYIGNGLVVHAATFGVPVKVTTVDGAGPYNSARRY